MTINLDYLTNLNPKQLEAVSHTAGPLLVLAGAGTGKTRVLTTRIINLIENHQVHPHNILAVTFTNKASREMHHRIRNAIHADGLNIGTFHSVSTRMLRSHITLMDLPLTHNFTIIDQDDQIKLVKNVANEKGIDIKIYPPQLLHTIISRWKDQGLLPEKIGSADIRNNAGQMAKLIYPEYQRQMQASNAVDFGDLLLYCNQLLINKPDILEYYQNKFKYILIDEYQDTNPVQYVWARMLASKHKNICCVGDDDQSIYSWRGAEVKNILRFEKDFSDATIIKLEQNYRSSSSILAAASSIIKNNKNRHEKVLWTNQNAGEKIKLISCWNDKEEARFVASEAENFIKSGKYLANQIAVLVRAGFQTRAFEEVFISNALPYQIIGGLRFYDRMEIRDSLAYIRLCLHQDDNLALERIINVPRRSIGNATLKKIKDYATKHNISAFAALKAMQKEGELKSKAKESLSSLIQVVETAGSRYKDEPAFEVTKFILEQSGYLPALKAEKTEEARARVENINEMLKAINEFDNIYEFNEHASLVMDNESLESGGGALKIMTLHAAKGLEFNVVFLPGWEEGIFPHQKALNDEGEKGLEEERRIAYVGITRAKDELYITYAESRRIFAEFVNSLPSRFINEISSDVCQRSSSTRNLNYLGSRHNFALASNISQINPATKLDMRGKKPGSRIKHEKFGMGIVVRRNGDNLEIAFEKIGLKTIKEDYVEEVG